MVAYDDPRKTAFLAEIPAQFRGDVNNRFLDAIRAGETDRALIARMVWVRVGEREEEARRTGYELGPGTIPAAPLRAAMGADRARTLDYIGWLIEWDRLTPAEKQSARAERSAAWRNRWWRAQDGGAR
jgi:hypothetical protein